MKRILLKLLAICTAVLAVPIGAEAQTEKGWSTGATVGEGDFYLYNTGTKQYLAAGHSEWGTKASSMPHARKLTLTQNGDGYNIDTQISNGGVKNYLATTWMDGVATAWTFTSTNSEGITNGYTLNNGTADLTAPSADAALENSTDATDNSEWLLLTADMIKEAMNSLTYDGDTYIDATPFIKCPDIIRNDLTTFSDNWTFSTSRENSNNFAGGGGYNNGANLCGEVYNATFDLYQELTDMPNGKYILRVQGFQRTDGSTKVAKLYANSSESDIMLLSEGTNTSTNSMNEASKAFTEGDFSNNSVEVTVTDGTLKIGIKKESAVGSTDWVIFDNFSLEYYGIDSSSQLSALQATLQEKIEACAAYDNAIMSSAARTALDEAKSAAESAEQTEAALTTAITNLTAALTDAEKSVAAYSALNDALTTYNEKASSLDDAGQASYNAATADIQTAYANGTYSTDEATSAATKVAEAYTAAVKAQTTDGADYTALITNPSFETGDLTGWTYNKATDTGVKANSNGTYTTSGIDGNYLFNTWGGSSEKYIQQTVTLPAGVYTLSALIASDAGNSITLSANSISVTATTENDKTVFQEASLDFVLTEETAVTIKVSSTAWYKADNFRLTYSSTLSDTQAEELLASVPTGTMNADVETALNSAKTAFENEKNVANYATLSEAISAANASIAAYTTAKDVLPKMKALTETTNFYTTDAYNTYYQQWQDKYDARTLTTDEANALEDPTVTDYNNRFTNYMAPTFLLDVWDDGGSVDDNNELSHGDYYINTWSSEGESDGSGMTVPFFEYYVDNSSTLAEKTLNGTMTGLTANQLYKVSALVRVQVTNSGSNGSGITMQVGEGTTVDVCGGTASSTTGYYYGTYTATGKADADGNLTLKFVVADGNNISWLAFRDVNYEETSVDLTELEKAIELANWVNGGITNGVKSLAEAITTAEALLESTSQDDIDAGVVTLNAATKTAEAIVTARLRAAGEYKKYTALNTVIGDDSQTDAIAALQTVAENAEATVDDVTAAEAAVTLLDNYTKLSIANNGFDESPNIAADGTNSGTLIDPATTAKPYLWSIPSWDGASTFGNTAAHVNTAVYGANCSSVGGTNGTNSPATDMYGASEGGVCQMSAGWGDQARYKQSVTLPAGTYIFYYEAYNANSSSNAINDNYFGVSDLTAGAVEGTTDTFAIDDNKTFAYGEWTACANGFNLTQTETGGNISIGVSQTGGSGNCAKLWIDNVEVYYIPATMETYTRKATTTGWGTICLPYAATPGDDVTIYEIDGVDNTEDPSYVIVSEAETMEAGKPYIYKTGDDGTTLEATFTQNNTTTVDAPVAGKNGLTGVFTSSVGLVTNGSYILSGGLWYEVSNADVFDLGDNRAYIADMSALPAATSSSKSVKMTLNDGGTTGIKGVAESINAGDNTIYTLGGQRVSKVTKGNLYIVNGKKVLVK